MSFRTIIVGILAAICGVSATLGVNLLNGQANRNTSASIVVARINIGYGVELTKEMITLKEWPAKLLPAGCITKLDDAVGQFAKAPIIKDEPIMTSKVSPHTTNLHIPDGMRGVAIETPDESSAVGKLIVPGNRVDVILTVTRHDLLSGPETWTLLENVEVLAVGQRFDPSKKGIDDENDHRSITLLVTPEMAENINLAAELGKLHLALRSPSDKTGLEPRTKKNIGELFKELASEKSADSASDKLNALSERKKVNAANNAALKIPAGMRAVTIQTPDESAGVAGLVQPEDRVDVLFTLDAQKRRSIEALADSNLFVATHTLLENVEVLAVDTKMDEAEGANDPKMSRSVTLLVTPEMAKDISLAQQVGALAMTLRGKDEGIPSEPVHVVNLSQLMMHGGDSQSIGLESNGPRNQFQVIRVNRGGFSQDLRFYKPQSD